MRLDPHVALLLIHAAEEALTCPCDAHRQGLRMAVTRARDNDAVNRMWLETTMAEVGQRMPRAGDFTNTTEVLPVREGRYGS